MTEKQILRKFINNIRKKFITRLPRATGKTIKSVGTEVLGDAAVLYGGKWIVQSVETGRGMIKNIGDTEFWKALKKWMSAVGFSGGVTERSAKSLAHYINVHGTKTYRTGKTGVISGFDIDPEIYQMTKELGDMYQIYIVRSLVKGSKIAKQG